jgi:HEPN domain-containing protein
MNEGKIDYWVTLSEYDLVVARALLDKEHYLYMGFMCHQSVEKMLKACCVKKNITPPPIHKLDRLIELAGLKTLLTEDQFDLLDELIPLNIQARYPAHKDAIYKLVGKSKAFEILSRTEEFITWLKQQTR